MGTMTEPTAVMWDIVDAWESLYATAVFSGINGDAQHQTKPGKHLSRSINNDKFGSNCWPLEAPNDKKGPNDKAIAIDMSMSTADMKTCHNRLKAVYNNRANDWRATYIYAFNGWDGTNGAGRYNLYKGTVDSASDDHKWHEHGEGYYAFANDRRMFDAWVSALSGESADGDDLVTSQEQFNQFMFTFLDDIYTATEGDAFRAGQLWRAFAGTYKGGPYAEGMNSFWVWQTTYATGEANKAVLAEIASKVDIDPEELAAIQQAAYDGAMEGAADPQVIIDGVLAGLAGAGMPPEWIASVEQAMRNVLMTGAAPPTTP